MIEIQALKKLNSLKPILFWNSFLAIILVLSACSDWVKESDTGACNNAIDSRDYDTALTVCTSRKDKATAYMGKAGYDIINLLDSSGTAVVKLTDDSNKLGKNDAAGASILNILKKRPSDIKDLAERTAKITSSKNNLDSASALLQPYLAHDSSPLNKDEILLNTFAISFAMQLDQIISFDNGTTSTTVSPTGDDADNLDCAGVTGADETVLVAKDGHLWDAERNSIQCNSITNAIKGLGTNAEKATAIAELKKWYAKEEGARGLLPVEFRCAVCRPFNSLTTYLTDLTANIAEFSVSGSNAKAITDADNSTTEMMKKIGCPITKAEKCES